MIFDRFETESEFGVEYYSSTSISQSGSFSFLAATTLRGISKPTLREFCHDILVVFVVTLMK
jgi:hypothetical protein